MDKIRILFLLVVAAAWVGCASGGGSGSGQDGTQAASSAESNMPQGYSAPPPGSDLAKVQLGWNDAEVRKLLGDPDNANAYMTGKAWIPFYHGPDTHRTDWMYKGKGRVVFSRNRYSGSLKVIRVLYNPNELM